MNTPYEMYGFLYLLFACGLTGCLFANAGMFVDGDVVGKKYCFYSFLVLLLLWAAIRLVFSKKEKDDRFGFKLGLVCFTAAVAECVFTAVKGHGSLNNNAGLAICLCAAWPFGLLLFQFCHLKWQKVLSGILWALVAVCVILSGSRTGILTLTVCSIICIAWYRHWGKMRIACLLAIGVIVALAGLYFIRPDSARGRILIWQCSWDLFCQKPLLGYGSGGFMAHYMDCQASWLAARPDCPYSDLADNVKTPFNEWLNIMCQYGLVGLAVSIAILLFVFGRWMRERNQMDCFCAGLSMCAIICCSCFSYPFSFPFIWTVVIVDCMILFKGSLSYSKIINRVLAIGSLVGASFLCLFLIRQIPAQVEWKRMVDSSPFINGEQAFLQYCELEKTLGKNPYFLYNFAAELCCDGQWENGLSVSRKCRILWADYDLEMLMGDACLKLTDYESAETHYKLASEMCPCRFFPLYNLMEIYRCQNRYQEYEVMAKRIIDKPIKVYSEDVERIKMQAENYYRVLKSEQ